MTDERIDAELREGFAGLTLPPERLAALRAQATPPRGRWQAALIVVAAAAVVALAVAPLLPSPPAEVEASAPGAAPIEVRAGHRALGLEVGRDALWPEALPVGRFVDVALVLRGEHGPEVLVVGERLEVLGTSVEEGSLTLQAPPQLAERLVHASQQGPLFPLVDLGRGRRGVPIQVDPLPLRTGLVEEGSQVDVLLTEKQRTDDGMRTITVGADLRVIGSDAEGGRLLVEAEADVAAALLLANQAGVLTVALRGR